MKTSMALIGNAFHLHKPRGSHYFIAFDAARHTS